MVEWDKVAEGFWRDWQYPACVGALDGKHVRIKCPKNSGTDHYNYKGYFSNVLLALVDAKYRFIYVNIGAQGSLSDGGILSNSDFGKALQNNEIAFPPDTFLPNSEITTPYVIVGKVEE